MIYDIDMIIKYINIFIFVYLFVFFPIMKVVDILLMNTIYKETVESDSSNQKKSIIKDTLYILLIPIIVMVKVPLGLIFLIMFLFLISLPEHEIFAMSIFFIPFTIFVLSYIINSKINKIILVICLIIFIIDHLIMSHYTIDVDLYQDMRGFLASDFILSIAKWALSIIDTFFPEEIKLYIFIGISFDYFYNISLLSGFFMIISFFLFLSQNLINNNDIDSKKQDISKKNKNIQTYKYERGIIWKKGNVDYIVEFDYFNANENDLIINKKVDILEIKKNEQNKVVFTGICVGEVQTFEAKNISGYIRHNKKNTL